MAHFQEQKLWWHACERYWKYGLHCPLGGIDKLKAGPQEHDPDEHGFVDKPAPPPAAEPQIALGHPKRKRSHPGKHYDRDGNLVRQHDQDSPIGNRDTPPWQEIPAAPGKEIPQIKPEEIERAAEIPQRSGQRDIFKESPYTTEREATPRYMRDLFSESPYITDARAQPARAVRSPANQFETPYRQLGADAEGAKRWANSTQAQASQQTTGYMSAAAATAAAASTTGRGGQSGPPSAMAELQSTAIAETALARYVAARRKSSARGSRPASVPRDVPDEVGERRRRRERDRYTGGEKLRDAAIATKAADAVGRGVKSLGRKGASPETPFRQSYRGGQRVPQN